MCVELELMTSWRRMSFLQSGNMEIVWYSMLSNCKNWIHKTNEFQKNHAMSQQQPAGKDISILKWTQLAGTLVFEYINGGRPSRHSDKPIHDALVVACTQPWYQAPGQSTRWLSWGPNCCHLLRRNNTPSVATTILLKCLLVLILLDNRQDIYIGVGYMV